jgi:protein-serine/threonine kinase
VRSRALGGRRPSLRFPTVAPYFVVADDAEDIKAHAFFRGVVWDEMHLSRPPWVPTIKRDQSLARWFEDESDIIGTSEDHGSSLDIQPVAEDPTTIGVAITTDHAIPASNGVSLPTIEEASVATDERTNGHLVITEAVESHLPTPDSNANGKKKKSKAKKRPRDKILRDPVTGPTAMAERKAKAFLGYTYRRPEVFALSSSVERAGRAMTRPSVYDIVGVNGALEKL